MHLRAIKVNGLRSLVDPKPLELKPLTLLVGANSAGKSTMLRTIPLLRQSVETRTRGPLLWFGDYVDFGSFEDAINSSASTKEIEFSFDVGFDTDEGRNSRDLRVISPTDICAKLTVGEIEGDTYTKTIELSAFGHKITFTIDTESNVSDVELDSASLLESNQRISLHSEDSLFSLASYSKVTIDKKEAWVRYRRNRLARKATLQHIDRLFHGGATHDTRVSFINSLGIGSLDSLLVALKQAASLTQTSSQRARSIRTNSPWLRKLQGLLIAYNAEDILAYIDTLLVGAFKNSSYIGPVRATAQRFYRQQELSINEVDPEGSNLAMFLMGLPPEERNNFSNWCRERVGFGVEPKIIGSHASVFLRPSEEDTNFNIADMGFGYSQLLPVLATVWQAENYPKPREGRGSSTLRRRMYYTRSNYRNSQKIVTIEQPELHLHPKFQGKLADLFATISCNTKSPNNSLSIICETHSETIINRLGELVSNRQIDPSNIQILLFEKERTTGQSTIRSASYDSDGILENWPYGFFLA